MSSPFHSLRWRLQAWHGLILGVAVLALCATVHRLATFDRFSRIDRDLIGSERLLFRTLFRDMQAGENKDLPPSPAEMLAILRKHQLAIPEEITNHFSGNDAGFRYFIIRDQDGSILMQSNNVPAVRLATDAADQSFREGIRTDGTFREARRGSPDGFASVIGRDISPDENQLTRFTWSLAACGLATWLAGLLGGWWLAGRAIKPIASISSTATRIAEGNLDERISTAGTASELDQLSHVLNDTFDRLNAAFERQRRFTADAAHELRTPVTILLNESQRILKRERSTDEYRQSIMTCQETAQRMRRLTETLLLLARQEAAADRRTHAPGDLARVAAETVAQLGPLAATHQVSSHTSLAPAPARIDADAVAILVSNLVGNAIHHHHATGGNVWVSTATVGDQAVLIVRDDGPGIASDDLRSIFERFHRADQARTGGSGHTGLGLAIAQAIAANHCGTIEVASELGHGTTFTVHLPLA